MLWNEGLGGGIRRIGMGGGPLNLGMEGQPPRQRRMMTKSAAGRDVVLAEDEDGMTGLEPYQIRHFSCSVCWLHYDIVFL